MMTIKLTQQISGILTVASRDFTKFVRDRPRIISSLIFPFIFIAVIGGAFDSALSDTLGFDYLAFVFVGVIAQTLFQSSALGLISLIRDRDEDFSQEIFVSPISRYSIILGKITGESLVSFGQVVGILLFAFVLNVELSGAQIVRMLPAGILAALLGGSFGVIVLSRLKSQMGAQQIFPFLIFPQVFLSGVFTPIETMPAVLKTIAYLVPMTYAVEPVRAAYYAGSPHYAQATSLHPALSTGIGVVLAVVFVLIGTAMFVRGERNR